MAVEHDDRFDAALEDCCRRVQQGEDLDHSLAGYPASYRNQIAELVPLSSRLRQLSHVPSREFQARLEQTLLVAAAQQGHRSHGERHDRIVAFFRISPLIRALAVVLVAVVILGGGGVGAVKASDDSLPDSPLYQLKTAREWLERNMARDADSRVAVQVRQFESRVREMDRAVRADKRQAIVTLGLRFAFATKQLVDLALELKADGHTQPADRVLGFVRAEQRHVDALILQASPEARPALRRLNSFLQQQERRLTAASSNSRGLPSS